MFKRRNLLMVFWLLQTFFFSLVYPDRIYLKNGRFMEGIIIEEKEEKVRLDIGVGTISIPRRDILSIKYDNDAEQAAIQAQWRAEYALHPDYIPISMKNLYNKFSNLERERNQAQRKYREFALLEKKAEKLKKQIQINTKKMLKKNKQLKNYNPEDNPSEYNQLVKEYNQLVYQLQSQHYQLKELEDNLSRANREVSSYGADLYEIIQQVAELKNGELTKQEEIFLNALTKELAKLKEDFSSYNISYTKRGAGVMVDAYINKYINAKLVVDTGASVVALAPYIGERLFGAKYKENKPITVTLADGRQSSAYPVILDSVRVGDAEVNNVMAVIFEDDPGIDGLLGMSFLQNFNLRFDPSREQLILDKFNP